MPANVEAADAGHHDVGHNHIILIFSSITQSSPAVRGSIHRPVLFFQTLLERPDGFDFVFDEEDTHGANIGKNKNPRPELLPNAGLVSENQRIKKAALLFSPGVLFSAVCQRVYLSVLHF